MLFNALNVLKMWFCEEQKRLKSDENLNSHIPDDGYEAFFNYYFKGKFECKACRLMQTEVESGTADSPVSVGSGHSGPGS